MPAKNAPSDSNDLRQILEIISAVGLIGMLITAVVYCATEKFIWLFVVFVVVFLGGIVAMGKLAPRNPRQPKNPYRKR